MAHRSESPGLLIDALFFGDPLKQVLGNELAELLENSGIGLGCFWYHTLGLPPAKDRKQPNFHFQWDASVSQYVPRKIEFSNPRACDDQNPRLSSSKTADRYG